MFLMMNETSSSAFRFKNEYIDIGPRSTPERYPHNTPPMSTSPLMMRHPSFTSTSSESISGCSRRQISEFFNAILNGKEARTMLSCYTGDTLIFDFFDLRHQHCDGIVCTINPLSHDIWLVDIAHLISVIERSDTLKRVTLTMDNEEVYNITLEPLYRYIRHVPVTPIERIYVNGQLVFCQTEYNQVKRHIVVPYQPRLIRAPSTFVLSPLKEEDDISNRINSSVWNSTDDVDEDVGLPIDRVADEEVVSSSDTRTPIDEEVGLPIDDGVVDETHMHDSSSDGYDSTGEEDLYEDWYYEQQ